MSIKRRPSSLIRLFNRPRLFLMVGVILVGNMITPTTAEAKGWSLDNIGVAAPLNNKEDKIKTIEKSLLKKKETVEEKQASVEKLKKESEELVQSTADIQKQLDELKERVAWLSDMFVNPVKYSSTSGGNAYAPGNCTWYVKQKRPDIGSFWGNANQWYYSAQSDGFAVGSKPKVHAIGVTQEGWAGHVVYVEKVALDGSTVTVSEMNYGGLYQMNYRTVPAAAFQYIYEKM